MDNSEFVNQYIDVMTKNLHDLLGRNLISETKIAMAEKALAALKAQHEELESKAEGLQSELDELLDIRTRYEALVQEAQTLRVDYDSVRNDLGIARNKIAELDAVNEEIILSNQDLRNTIEKLAPGSLPPVTQDPVDTAPKKKQVSPKEL